MFSKSTIKYIQSLQQKKFRDEYNVFVAEGPKVVGELLIANVFKCTALYALQEWLENIDAKIREQIADRIEIVKHFELTKIAAYTTANQVVAVFEKREALKRVDVTAKITLVLDDIRDPGNLGTIIRTADWFGVSNIICSNNTVDIYNPKVVQSSMASLANVQVLYTDLLPWLGSQQTVKKIATTLTGSPAQQLKATQEAIIIIGNESNGISAEVLALADEKITISGKGTAESLNAGVATGIILYALTMS